MAAMANQDHDHAGPPAVDAIGLYTELAVDAGLIREGDKLDQAQIDFATALVERCACLGDWYSRHDDDGNAGEHIRAELLP